MGNIKKSDGFELERLLVLPDYVIRDIEKHPLIAPFYVTDIGYFPRAKYHYRERIHGCDSHIVIYCAEGEGWIEINGTKLTIKPTMLMIIPKETPHRYGASEQTPWSIYWFHLGGTDVDQFIEGLGLKNNLSQLKFIKFVKFLEIFNNCFDFLSNRVYSHLHHIHVSQSIKYLLSNVSVTSALTNQDRNKEDYLDKAIHFMNENMNKTIKLDDVAKYSGLSKQHLTHLFKSETSYPPIDYFIRMKMQRAAQTLDLTENSIKQIAVSLGIDDPYYFSRIFKKIMGTSPSQYRKIKKG
ncbi:helix-turn-helix domain-containing protein [Metabacillus litoralis]|uniref:Helix-turn-helix domain-containing protein n=1 Tax=Metabacillus litoralis TaxID=152268 RepID=A0A5C6W5J0_9BACI|nr:helix-turn-helix domain-containing protein [Metabacillus litoralis]TXC92664.1 helix-turn-helix domain-containing protein [Metabacillus litoralis]